MKIEALSLILAAAPAAWADWDSAEGKSIKYTSVQGYFLQDDPATNPSGFDYVCATSTAPFIMLARFSPFDSLGGRELWSY
jgi:hypothetical protein